MPVTGYVYDLDSKGTGQAKPEYSITGTTFRQANGQVEIRLLLPAQSVPLVMTLTPEVNATYGNNLKAGASRFKNQKLGPYSVGDGSRPMVGSNRSSGSMYFFPDDAACIAGDDSWSLDLSDLELSLYAVTLTQTISATSSTATCLRAGTAEAVGTAMFVDSGLLVFYADKTSASANDAPHKFVSVKLFKPN